MRPAKPLPTHTGHGENPFQGFLTQIAVLTALSLGLLLWVVWMLAAVTTCG